MCNARLQLPPPTTQPPLSSAAQLNHVQMQPPAFSHAPSTKLSQQMPKASPFPIQIGKCSFESCSLQGLSTDINLRSCTYSFDSHGRVPTMRATAEVIKKHFSSVSLCLIWSLYS